MSQTDLAEAIDGSRATVSNYERGAREPLRVTLRLWAMATGVDFHWIETGHAPSPDGDGACRGCAIRDLNPEPAD
ncbi:helix-turn-helix domain-containing protein [Gordonia sp. MP11Mi]|uniref:helix-turn-helix domain-containing protein n=1 Tax=Gordonia sp. MP11Mi TaxID=3022769 RepID=UPI003B20FD82